MYNKLMTKTNLAYKISKKDFHRVKELDDWKKFWGWIRFISVSWYALIFRNHQPYLFIVTDWVFKCLWSLLCTLGCFKELFA